MRWLIVPAVFLALVGCKGSAGVTCPPLVAYSAEFQAAAAVELEDVRATHPHLRRLLDDYGLTRNAIRACIKKRGK